MQDLPDLLWRVLPELRESGNLTQVAERLSVSQPAVSKVLAKAEATLGVSLLRRDERPVKLTSEGKLLAEFSEQRIGMETLLARRLDVIRKRGAGLVRIASFGASSSTRILPPLLKRMRQRLPEIEIEIVELTDQDASRAVKEGLVDFATLAGWDHVDMEYIPLAKDRLVALVPEGMPLSGKVSVTPEDLAKEEFIMTKGGSEPLVRDWFRGAGVQPNVRHTALQLTSIMAMVRAGFGLSVVAEMAVPENHPEVTIIPLDPVKQREIYLCRPVGSFASHAAERFWNVLI